MQEYKVSCAFIENLQRLSRINLKFSTFVSNYNLSELSVDDTDAICLKLADYLLNPEYTVQITECFRQDFLKILALAVPDIQFDSERRHLRICVLLAKVLTLHPDAERFVLKYFKERPPPFMDDLDSNPPLKRCKLEKSDKVSDLEIVQVCYSFLKHNPEFFRRIWPWSKFIQKYFDHEDKMLKWYCCQCIAILTGMNENQLNDLLHQSLTRSESNKCCINNEFKSAGLSDQNSSNDSAFNDIHLPIYQTENVKSQANLIEVESTKENLRKISLGIAANKAVNLVGPVGSGKTTLVEYLAGKVGRVVGESFIKIQLGDQTDSKMLLGTYRCTDIPGEFVWQPGVLTQAVIDGSWILLEDIDSANVDITSILSSVLENGYLTVPGYRDAIPVSSGFQLFVTQRLTPTITGGHKKHTNATILLEKRILQVNLDPLSEAELQEIIQILHPTLKTICTRMVKVFSLFSSNGAKPIGVKASRLTSARDLFKWCARAVVDFDVSSQGSALKVLQDAIDIFCCSHSNLEERLSIAREISTHLGIINEKANYFCNQHKPSVILSTENFIMGRTSLKRQDKHLEKNMKFCFTRPVACLLERIMCCVQLGEPVLLVGETGTGKTSCVQYLAHMIGQKLVVVNMNQQSDSADLLGGFKPIDMRLVVKPVKTEFENVFRSYFNVEVNKQFLRNISYCYNEQRYDVLLKLMRKSHEAAIKRLSSAINRDDVKLEKYLKFWNLWTELGKKLQKLEIQLKQKNSLAFTFIEGSLVKAIENGHWVLLDEINLANAETLECLSGLLEGPQSSISLLERGDKKPIKRHENFTLFACMNPSTDIGKKDLPVGLRNRFTEFFVDELTEKNDLALLVNSYLDERALSQDKLENIVKFYLTVRKEAVLSLSDGLGHKPHFSLRSLCRALTIGSKNPCGSFIRSLYEAFCLSFLTQLDLNSCKRVEAMIVKYVVGNVKEFRAVLNQPMPVPDPSNSQNYLQFEGYWIHKGALEPEVPEDYILTSSVRKNLRDLARVVSIGKLPVLLQGDTSIGKTSLIMYLAKCSGNRCVRINNHEHTDLQEYIGSYIADVNGKLVFREGVLVEAMRKGHWIILDELNLAPTDVLEALNRVLDDNRELFIPETQETVKADPKFMLFATQNPPGAYGGRKMLSRAFRNRFVELHFNEIPSDELEFILHKRCQMAPSYAKKMINIMKDLQTRRRSSAAFAGKHGFITLRDLFKWGERYRLAENKSSLYDWDQHIADEGYLVLAGRVRKNEEKEEIIQVIKKYMKREVNPQNIFTLSEKTSTVTRSILEDIQSKKDRYKGIFWTYNMQQHAVLVSKAMQFHEPVLLVGETGSGKTTICKLLAENNGQELITVNCHMHTESSDFIGGLRPVRTHTDEDLNKLFEWCDGPLIQAMVQGNVFLADEISLADDSVLERLNSLLEPERSLLLAEKGIDINNKDNSELVVAHKNFHFVSTMNPGGDFGKKELSPALRNRLTEIWCDSCNDRQDLISIIEHNVKPGISLGNQEDCSSGVGKHIMDFIDWFRSTEIGRRFTISVRDILTWTHFINSCFNKAEATEAFLHGACLTFLDSLGSGVTSMESPSTLKRFRNECVSFLSHQIEALNLQSTDLSLNNLSIQLEANSFKIGPFSMEMGDFKSGVTRFSFDAPTTLHNTLRLLRGLQLNKAILLEGSPGVGKTSIVMALAKATRNTVFRVNLSDQTDISDLFGADLPVEGGKPGHFAWRDGPLLQALKRGHWILLDELNLAPQSVLEGLNACLDHRGEIFIPELGKTFLAKPGTRFFACQNPTKQGGSRRGLPKSFLNRFTQVYVSPLNENDLRHILKTQFPELPDVVLQRMVDFNTQIVSELEKQAFGYKGGPWEFNLRDLTRWCEATLYHYENSADEDKSYAPECLVGLIYSNRMRSSHDRECVARIFESVFGKTIRGNAVTAYVTHTDIHLGDICLKKESSNFNVSVAKQETSLVLRSQLGVLRSLAYCVRLNWMSILVGNAGCGKTSVVRTLAQLCGKTLHTLPVNSAMDTTDLLGGFEQTDYTRHLEEISKQTEQLVYLTVQKMLVRKEKSRAAELLRSWENSAQLLGRVTQNQTLLEETQLFLEKIDTLNKVWNSLLDCDLRADQKQTVENLQNKSKSIESSVKDEGCLNAGGKFEWVDSILVKCLVNGSWLLIDNVNLCSPAVLDRLNALLEPNGTLTIGERGIDDDGKMIEIKPHEDFRLFMTMDPKNGEISRAMRNRGIEIYLLNESELGITNIVDVKSLMTQNGLTDQHITNVLLQMHDFISRLIPGEKPNVNHIIQSSFLVAQQLKRGINIRKALHSTIIDVYYRTKSSYEFSTNDAQTLILTELDGVLNFNPVHDLYDYDATFKTLNLQCNSEMSKVKQQIVVLDKCLQGDPPILRMIQYYLVHFYSIASSEDIELRQLFIAEKYHDLKNVAMALYEEMAGRIGTRSLPADQRWVIDLPCKRSECNKLLMILYFISYKSLNETVDSVERLKGKKDFTLLEYITCVKSRKIEGKIDDVVVKGLYDVLRQFDEFVAGLLRNASTELNDADVVEVLSSLQWRFLLYQILKQDVITNVTQMRFEEVLTNLHVHYKWFFKYSITKLNSMFPACKSDDLIREVNEINSNLSSHFSIFKKIARRYQKNINSPLPLTNKAQINVLSEYNAMADAFNLNKGIFAGDLLQLLIDVKAELCQNFVGVPENFLQLKQAFDEHQKSNPESKGTPINILLTIDYFALLTMYKTRSDFSHDSINSPTIPPSLQGVLKCGKLTNDERLRHEITSRITQYTMTCASLAPSTFLNDEEDLSTTELHLHLPVLSYLVTNVLVNKDVASTEFGNYRNTASHCRQINLSLWKNMQSISGRDYDYLSLETKYLQRAFQNFISEFTTSLLGLIQNDDDVTVKVNACVGAIEKIYSTSGGGSPERADKEALISLLQNCLENISSLGGEHSTTKTINLLANAYVHLNYLKAWLNSKLAVIDPLVKVTLKTKYCLEEKTNLHSLKLSYEMQNIIYSGVAETLPTLCENLHRRIMFLQEKSRELGQYLAVRPESLSYDSILKKINHGFSTILTRIKIIDLNNNVDNCVKLIEESISQNKEIRETDMEKCRSSLRLTSSCVHSINSFVDILSKTRFLYPDIIEPLLSNVRDLLYGIKLKGSLLQKLILQYTNAKQGVTLHEDLIDFIKFPALNENRQSCIESVDLYMKDNFQNFVRECIESNSAAKQENLILLKCGIQEMYNACVIDAKYTRILTKELFVQFNKLIAIFINAWNKQETERETKIKEAESLYKVKTKCEEISEEQTIEKEFKSLFPNYHVIDFPDLQAATLEEDDGDENAPNFEPGLITLDDVKFVSDLHKQFMCAHTASEWLNPQRKNLACDYVKPLMQKFRLFKTLVNQMVHCLNYDLDAEVLGSLSVLSRVAQKFGDTTFLDEATSPSKSGNKKKYNFYVDSNVEEVTGSYHVLEELRIRILELLNEWPDHPTLQNIHKIIQRIYGFDVTSPLSRFLTGFEILLTTCNEWEQNAHAGVSLQPFSLNVTHQIISWRKLELSMWRDSLNNSFERLNESISKWWLYLYNILKQFTEENLFTIPELIETLQKFITQSNLAEFDSRLELLFVFHCHCVHLQKTTETELLTNILWNVHNYYAQFIPVVNAKIKELRSPVERKLKDYVKIVRWKDISYWAVKETLDKTHKTIHKHMREFEGLLSHSVLSYLKNTTLNTDFENVGIWDRPQRSLTKTYHYAMDPTTYMAKQSLVKKLINGEDEESFLTKVSKYFNKSRVLCKNTVSSVHYPSLIQILDGFVADVSETGTLLDKTEIDTTLPKEKQKSQAKNLLHQKRTALAALFKSLVTIGLSYRTGIIESKQKDAVEDFLLKPLDLQASLSYLSHRLNDKKLLTIWDGCEMYYTKSLMRSDVLQSALNTPSKDLGPNNIERLKGFSSHLMKLNFEQKSQLIASARNLYCLRFYATYFSEFCDEEIHFLQAGVYDRMTAFLKNVVVVVKQYKLVLDSCPEEALAEATIPVLQPESTNSIQFKYDDQWNSAMSNINGALSDTEKILGLLVKSKTFIPHDCARICPKYLPVPDLDLIGPLLDALSRNLSGLLSVLGDIPLSSNLKWLLSNLDEIKTTLTNEDAADWGTPNDFTARVEQLIKRMLLSIQNVYKKYKEIQPETAEEQNDALGEQHLKTLIVENLLEDLKQFNMKPLVSFITVLARQVAEINPSHHQEFRNTLAYALPILEQLILLYEYFITQQVLAYRVSCKMTAVLLNIFIELATKGFCIPPELSEEMNSEGQQQSGGMGLGEGDGEKDVSDRIESEDQLEDANPSGEDKKQDDQKDCKEEEKGIDFSEDFDSKLQDIENQPGEDSDEEEAKSDAEEQMGETDKDAEQLDQQIWGSDEEVEEEANNEEEDRSEDKGDKGKQEGEKELTAKDGASKNDEEETEESKEKRPQNKDINEMDDREYDDQQIDPYHGNQPELPETEPMDLPDEVQLDDAEKENDESQEDNPFDVDAMKEQFPPKEDQKDDEPIDADDGDNDKKEGNEDLPDASDEEQEAPENKKDEKEDDLKNIATEEEQNENESTKQSGLDETETKGEDAQPMDVDDVAADNVQANQANIQNSTNTNEDVRQDDGPDKEGVGQSQVEDSNAGHKSGAQAHEESQQGTEEKEQPKQEKRQRPGDCDSQRSLGDVDQPAKKKLKTIEAQPNEPEAKESEDEVADAEMYQHIKDAKSITEQVLDAATKEQVEQQKDVPIEEEQPEGSENLVQDEEEDVDVTEVAQKKPEKLDGEKRKPPREKTSHPEGDVTDELNEMEIEGDVIKTTTVPRGGETTHHTQYNSENAMPKMSAEEIIQLRNEVEQQLSTWNEPPTSFEAKQAWEKISSVTLPLAQDLAEQLRLVLEPTQTSRLKGDYRTGRRINMRKVIPYIASQFRKDKIWLRRTKPSKREYQIVLAIDDSSSMADNHSKELAFESVALISKALSLLESGQLSVLSFGEQTEVLHKLTETFTESSGSKLMEKFEFTQKKTCIARLVDFASEMLTSTPSQTNLLNAKLLVIVSDGRGIFSEGENYVHQAVRRAKLTNIFIIFIIVENPKNDSSILDIRMPIFSSGKLLEIKSYMDSFPFPFYIILRDINSLPAVLSDALKQWFEMVSSST